MIQNNKSTWVLKALRGTEGKVLFFRSLGVNQPVIWIYCAFWFSSKNLHFMACSEMHLVRKSALKSHWHGDFSWILPIYTQARSCFIAPCFAPVGTINKRAALICAGPWTTVESPAMPWFQPLSCCGRVTLRSAGRNCFSWRKAPVGRFWWISSL